MTLAARGCVEVASVTCWVRVVNWVVMCPTAMPRSITTLVRSLRVGAGPVGVMDGRLDPSGTGVFLLEFLGCDITSAYDCSDSVSDGASQAVAASRSSINLCCVPSDFVSQSSW